MTSGSSVSATNGQTGLGAAGDRQPANLGDILERVLDKGLVIAGDIRVNLLDIELLTIKLRLVVASLETAREVGINWWETDPWLSGDSDRLQRENRQLQKRVAELEAAAGDRDSLEPAEASGDSEAAEEAEPATEDGR
ncbi:gas vesicle protein [Labedaea rhizosphaerae]|uniref:Gas vesicle protein GvpA/GvpJ/GvpM family n=1 Tax=Labedaea rhizosphaerae TaxID=598644 RepID=A0A4R6S3B5_LABRH|nr:gas vesicle protein GvpA/GvpJ/GvpM family [Labedaea rhizosphaerae]